MKGLFLCVCLFLSFVPIVLWGQSKVNKQSRGQKVAEYISLLTADSIKYWDCVGGRGGVALQKQGCEYMEYDEGRHREYVTRACMWLSTFFSVDQRRILKVFRYSSRYPAELDWKGIILKLTEDTLVVKRKGVRGRTIYIKSKDQSFPLKPALNPFNMRTAEIGMQTDTLYRKIDSICEVYHAMNACPDTMNAEISITVSKEGKVVMAKYSRLPPDSATYAGFYAAFLAFVKSIPYKPSVDIVTKETFDMNLSFPCMFLTLVRWGVRLRRELRQKRQTISKENSTAK